MAAVSENGNFEVSQRFTIFIFLYYHESSEPSTNSPAAPTSSADMPGTDTPTGTNSPVHKNMLVNKT